ncbi:MAG TPA: alkaline phosphatase family protein [Solirubrobacteraceae bacterium]|nr:alkaline phosphatase family protein [Solirubrobacteraceae bacterium]
MSGQDSLMPGSAAARVTGAPTKLVLCVIDAMAPAMLARAAAAGEAPTLAALMERGRYMPDCVAAFPSVTPVCAASIVTGAWQDRHEIPGMSWYHRSEERYVEYGSSFRASQRVGLARQLTDTVYNMNGAHLSRRTATVFEKLDDAGARTAGTTYLMYRGRHRHEPQRDTALTRLASTLLRHAVMGPRELFYADIFASRQTGCRSNLGMPGVRDRHSGCVGAYLVEHDLFDFLLLSLPDNDWHSHRSGPGGQVRSIALADAQLARVMQAAGGVDEFLEEHAVIVMADHSQAPITETISLQTQFAELGVLAPGSRAEAGGRAGTERPSIAVCPSQRAAMVYVLDEDRPDRLRPELVRRGLGVEGVELVMWLERDVHGAALEGVIASPGRGELRFCPGGDIEDLRGRAWSVEGSPAVLDAHVRDGRLIAPDHPDALDRVWSALTCSTSGDVLLSAAPGREFVDLGGQAHAGGGSHGSLRAEDSLGGLIVCGLDVRQEPEQWAIRDVAALVGDHFEVEPR